MRIHDTLLGLLFMALAAVFYGYTFTFPAFPGQRYGPSLFPQVIAIGIFLCGLLIAVRGWRSGTPWLHIGADLRRRHGLLSFLAMPAAIVFYLLAAERLGFIPTATVVVGALAWWFGVRPWRALLLGVAVTAVVQWFFGSLMRVPLPRGLFMQLVAGG
jgi:putative tricarboxylic transport membrane protein